MPSRRSFIEVRVGKVPGRIEKIALNGARTVDAAFETAGLDANGEIRVNGRVVRSGSTKVKHGDTIVCIEKITGN